jgi:serine palmitoyltransferase
LTSDDAANFNIENGIHLARASIIYFRHNDMEHLEQILKSIQEKDLTKPFKQLSRRFIVVEGLYQNRGDLCPLAKIIDLKEKYRYRVILDDSMGIGVLGETGRGSIEHWGIDPKLVDILSVTLDTSIGSVGGICAGSYQIVDHQRLSGVGYVFSASSPPYTCVAAIEGIKIISGEKERSKRVRENARHLRFLLSKIPEMIIEGDEVSPIILIRAGEKSSVADQNREYELEFFELVAKELARNHQIFVGVSTYVPSEPRPPRPSLRVLVSADHTKEQLEGASKSIKKAISSVLTSYGFGQEKNDTY